MPKMKFVGVVKTDKMKKTRRVEIPRIKKHPLYGKYVRTRTVCYVHDENDESAVNDVVEIEESRPTSKLKRWTLVRIVKKAEKLDG
ncbi:MAG: 30S ribosomal protein S17 [Thermoguttaceae bacterium]|jgi:small subunit ribosomal protein S17